MCLRETDLISHFCCGFVVVFFCDFFLRKPYGRKTETKVDSCFFLRFEPLGCDPKEVLLVIFGDMPGAAELASFRDTRDRGFGE